MIWWKRFGSRAAVVMILGLTACASAYGQRGAASAASLAASLSVFGGGSDVNTDYGTSQSGYVFGIDYTRYLHRFFVDPSLELRGLVSPKGRNVGQTVFSGGLKVEHAYGRYHPYADFLLGQGVIKFEPVRSDNSTVYTYGGGLDVDLVKHFAVKVDYQGSHWKTGNKVTFTPSSLNIAVVYHIPFAPRYKE